ncbi:MAG TPA: phosphocholine cytidylyltransferase family protein [Candidatus Saccharimonadales bacterium]|nr:phosphocholine cytidylyltransferase family protein [Candidatus Saccharimonadales bacterium]
MKALILAAGRGTRIRSIHGERPKCLISYEGEAILDHQINGLFAAGIREIGIVVGYESGQIVRHVQARYRECLHRFQFLHNPKFETTNNIYSLWMAREWLRGEPFIVLNADVLCEPAILIPAVSPTTPISMIVDPEWREETMKVIIRNGHVIEMSKKISRREFSGTYMGVTTFSAQAQHDFFECLDRIVGEGRVNEFFNVAVQELADNGMKVGFTSTAGLSWAEIDDPGDLAFAREHVFPKLHYASAA